MEEEAQVHGTPERIQDNANELAIVRVGGLMSLPAILCEYGCDPKPILESFGFKLSQFEHPDTEIPYLRASRLLAHCVAATGCDHLGLLMGMRTDPSHLGVVGFMLPNASDVGTALHALIRHVDLHDQGGTGIFDIDGEFASLGWEIQLIGVSATAQIYDSSIAVACNIMRVLCGADWRPSEVLLSRPLPQDVGPYKRFFRAPLRFDAERSVVVFRTHWLHHQLPGADSHLFDYLEQQAEDLHGHQRLDLLGKLHRFLRSSLATKKCTVTTAAQHLGMHERTLDRRLREKDTTFRQELDQIRYEMARDFLASTKATNEEIALKLGYAEGAGFCRSFKRWSGTTPARWRARHSNS